MLRFLPQIRKQIQALVFEVRRHNLSNEKYTKYAEFVM